MNLCYWQIYYPIVLSDWWMDDWISRVYPQVCQMPWTSLARIFSFNTLNVTFCESLCLAHWHYIVYVCMYVIAVHFVLYMVRMARHAYLSLLSLAFVQANTMRHSDVWVTHHT